MMRRRAAEEILSTEVAYVEQLSMLINVSNSSLPLDLFQLFSFYFYIAKSKVLSRVYLWR